MSKRGRCCGCFPNVVDLIISTTKAYHDARETDGDVVVDFIERLRRFHEEQHRELAERRNRVSQVA
ncbi:hypothetical protein ACQQ2Q_17810 [Agrobacterium sp. ES01]|uniref:hypothetical protein n=1 Tax=Agrobacterium sp. ES01 TaxID=3420714 RepID=UPI003D11F766